MTFVVCTFVLLGGLLVLSGGRARPIRKHSQYRVAHPMPTLAAGLSGAAVALIVSTVPVFALLAGLFAATVPTLLRRRKDVAALRACAQAWPALLDDMTSAVRAGLNLPEAVALAGNNAPGELRHAFTSFSAAYQGTGDFNHSLEVARSNAGDAVFDQVAVSLRIARNVGGHDLTQVLRSLSAFVRADLQLRGELQARQSWSVNAARMAVAAPWVVLALLLSRPSTVTAYRTLTGSMVLLAIAACSLVAYVAMLRIARLRGAGT